MFLTRRNKYNNSKWTKEQRGGILSLLLSTLAISLLGNILAGKGINRAREGIVRAAYRNKKGQKTTGKR